VGSRRIALCLAFTLAIASMGAQYRTTNFFVHAQDQQVAKQVGEQAEIYRKEKAIMWLGQEMPTWPQPCPLHVTVNMQGPSGATTFQFGQGRVLGMKMEIQGPLDRLLASVLPHEITHTVFAHHFRQPVPRWADEGGSVLSEDDTERNRHDRLTRDILNRGQEIPMRRLFALKEYPREVMCLYAQGYSMSDYLVKRSSYADFLNFLGHGMQHGWDGAVQRFYGHQSVDELEQAWLKHLRDSKGTPHMGSTQLASAQGMGQRPSAQPTNRPVVRLTAPPAQPLDSAPLYRGAMPTPDQTGQRFAPQQVPPLAVPQAPAGNWVPAPGFTPPPQSPIQSGPQAPPQTPTQAPQYLPPTVTLGPVQPDVGVPSNPSPRYVNPVGFPR
jgi:hypothetical protein